MFSSIGGPEIVLIFVVALLVFGPKKLPEIGQKIGRVIGEIRRATGELRSNVEREIGVDPLQGIQRAGRARREIIGSISDPIREAAKGTLLTARALPGEAVGSILRDAREVDPAEDEQGPEGGKADARRSDGREAGGSSAPPSGRDPSQGSRQE